MTYTAKTGAVHVQRESMNGGTCVSCAVGTTSRLGASDVSECTMEYVTLVQMDNKMKRAREQGV